MPNFALIRFTLSLLWSMSGSSFMSVSKRLGCKWHQGWRRFYCNSGNSLVFRLMSIVFHALELPWACCIHSFMQPSAWWYANQPMLFPHNFYLEEIHMTSERMPYQSDTSPIGTSTLLARNSLSLRRSLVKWWSDAGWKMVLLWHYLRLVPSTLQVV